jgi:hypothetical protein
MRRLEFLFMMVFIPCQDLIQSILQHAESVNYGYEPAEMRRERERKERERKEREGKERERKERERESWQMWYRSHHWAK